MKPNWSVQNEIRKRAQREADYAWAISNTNTELPKYETPKVEKNKRAWGLLMALRP